MLKLRDQLRSKGHKQWVDSMLKGKGLVGVQKEELDQEWNNEPLATHGFTVS